MHRIESPRTDDSAIEAEIRERASKAPRVTPADIEAAIASEHYFTADEGVIGERWRLSEDSDEVHDNDIPRELCLLTFCVLVLKNGFTVTGESACASPENFDAEIGCKVARANAVAKIWPLLGFRLRDHLAAPRSLVAAIVAATLSIEEARRMVREADDSASLAGAPHYLKGA